MKEILEMKKFYMGNNINSSNINKDKTAIVVVDMIEGFVNIGNFASSRVKDMAPNIVTLLEKFNDSRKVFFKDVHTKDSKEFNAYVSHCVESEETEIIKELDRFAYGDLGDKVAVISKNSTNGFLADGFTCWLNDNMDVENFIVVGCVTDICVSDFAKTLQCYIYENNLDKKVIVPVDCVETYDLGHHNGDIMNTFALYSMKLAGIEVVDKII